MDGAPLRFEFKGKSGKSWRLQVSTRRVAKVVRACQELHLAAAALDPQRRGETMTLEEIAALTRALHALSAEQ